jgi:hypothetical protein
MVMAVYCNFSGTVITTPHSGKSMTGNDLKSNDFVKTNRCLTIFEEKDNNLMYKMEDIT